MIEKLRSAGDGAVRYGAPVWPAHKDETVNVGAWRDMTLLAIDTETTGLEAGTDRIVELGACLYVPPKPTLPKGSWSRFGTLIDPGVAIPVEASEIHGITAEHVAGKPSLKEIAAKFLGRVFAADVLVGYNWPFDAAMLRAELGSEWDVAIEGKPVLDALVLVRLPDVGKYWPGKGRHQLDAVAARMGLPRRGKAHRASSDAELAIRVLQRFANRIPDDADKASRFLARAREEQDADFKAWLEREQKHAQFAKQDADRVQDVVCAHKHQWGLKEEA